MIVIDKANDGDSYKARSAELHNQIKELRTTIKVLEKEGFPGRAEQYEKKLKELVSERNQIKEKTGNILLRLNKEAHDKYLITAEKNGISFQQFARYGLAYLNKMLNEKKLKITETGIEEI